MTSRSAVKLTVRPQRGFSMIDVLVAIVVLATGLLALAVLQGAITRNGANARSRSQVAAFTESVVDRMRFAGYDTVAPSTAIADGATITPATACTTPFSGTLVNTLKNDAKCAQDAAGVSNLQTTINGTELHGTGSGSTFGSTVTAGVDAAYKTVTATTSWTDAAGQARSVSFSTTVDKVSVSTTDNSLSSQSFSNTFGGSPVIRESNPGNTLGVIPIAISDSQDAAATNPKPVVTNTGTTFSTLKYYATASALGGNQITQRTDTKVVQCSCKFGGAVTTSSNSSLATVLTQPYQPTYWDGTRYVAPLQTSTSSSTTGVDTATTQDSDCDICCRDRNDGIGNAVKFDNYSTDTNKYQYVSGVLTQVSSGTFVQACRMIRVDGIYATATDAHNNFFGLLGTSECSSETTPAPTGCTSSLTASDTVPSLNTETTYGDFIKHYIYTNFDDLKTTGLPTVVSSDPQVTDTASAMYIGSPYALNLPTSVAITLPNTVSRWLYARGLYIDHLETKAQTTLANAIASCGATDEDSINNCALSVLPFTTVNLTELANWSASDGTVIKVNESQVIGGDSSSPKRGWVTVPSSQTASANAYAIAETYVTNAGLTGVNNFSSTGVIGAANAPYDSTHTLTDQKQFRLTGSGSSGGAGSVYFNVALSGLSWMSNISNVSLDPSVKWGGVTTATGTVSDTSTGYITGSSGAYSVVYWGAIAQTCTGHGSGKTCTYTTTPNSATPTTSPTGMTVTIQNYNSQTTGSGGTGTNCAPVVATQCNVYKVSTVTIGSTSVSGWSTAFLSNTDTKGLQAGTVLTIPSTPGVSSTTATSPDLITVGFALDTTNSTTAAGTCTSKDVQTCTGHGSNQVCTTTTQYTYAPGTCPN